MDLVDKLSNISSKIPKLKDALMTEEATKTALIMPFIAALGYDVFDPFEVIPEYIADVGTKKGEKVDYAIKKDDAVIMLFECKFSGADLTQEHAAQLRRYFHVTSARFGVLTNGIEYWFFSDLEEANKMDTRPFFVMNMLVENDNQTSVLKKFTKSAFSQDDIITNAVKLKYTREIKALLEKQLDEPDEQFIRFFTSQIYSGKLTQQKKEEFSGIVKHSFIQFIKVKINESIQSVLSNNEKTQEAEEVENDSPHSDGIVTTEVEVDGYNIVRSILRETVDVKRIDMRDAKTYCSVLLDDNNRKPICRLRFNSATLYLGLFTEKTEEKIALESVEEIYKYADRLKATVAEYE